MSAPPPKDASTSADASWLVYMLECADGSLYTGVTNDMARRLEQHNDGSGARYTRSRRPVKLRYQETCADRSDALLRECSLRLLSRKEKEALVAAYDAGTKGNNPNRN